MNITKIQNKETNYLNPQSKNKFFSDATKIFEVLALEEDTQDVEPLCFHWCQRIKQQDWCQRINQQGWCQRLNKQYYVKNKPTMLMSNNKPTRLMSKVKQIRLCQRIN